MKDMLRWLVIGVGDITTRRVIPAILAEPRSRLHAILTRTPAKAEPYPARVYTSLAEALGDAAVDAVYVASPVAFHHPHTIASLRAGKHVLCEKPVALDHAQALAMQRAALDAQKTLSVAYYRRCYPKVQRARELLQAGAIGAPVFAEAGCHSWFDAANSERGWLVDPALAGGGPLFDIGSHRIDLLNYFFGTPVSVSAHLANVVHRYAVEDCATLLIEYEAGPRAVVDVRWHCRQQRDEFRITGVDGVLELSPLNSPRLLYPGGEESLPPHANLHYPCIHNFVNHLLDGEPLASSIATAQLTDWVTEKALAANRRR